MPFSSLSFFAERGDAFTRLLEASARARFAGVFVTGPTISSDVGDRQCTKQPQRLCCCVVVGALMRCGADAESTTLGRRENAEGATASCTCATSLYVLMSTGSSHTFTTAIHRNRCICHRVDITKSLYHLLHIWGKTFTSASHFQSFQVAEAKASKHNRSFLQGYIHIAAMPSVTLNC